VLAREALIGSAPGKAAGKSSTSKQEHLNTEDEMRASSNAARNEGAILSAWRTPGSHSHRACNLAAYERATLDERAGPLPAHIRDRWVDNRWRKGAW
jgi:hypothetical protein